MILDDLGHESSGGTETRSMRVRWRDQEATLAVTAPPGVLGHSDDATPFVTMCLLPAMVFHEDLAVVDATVDRARVQPLDDVVTLWTQWNPSLRAPRMTAPLADRSTEPPGRGTGAFFSRGVDSMFSALVERRSSPVGRLDHLVFVDGIEPVHSPTTRAVEIERATAAAAEIDLPLVVVTSTVRSFTDRFRGWGDCHGAALAGVATSLGGLVDTMVVPSTDGITSIVPYGSSPFIDHRFSTADVRVVHDDVIAGRMGKVAAIATQRPDLLPWLKVCSALDGPDNCGRCGKCLLTMAALVACDALDAATAFPPTIDLDLLAAERVNPLQSRVHWSEVLLALGETGHQGAVRAAMAESLRRSARPTAVRRARYAFDWARGARGRPSPSWRDPERSFDWRFSSETLRLLVHGGPERSLPPHAEHPRPGPPLREPAVASEDQTVQPE